MIDDIKYYYNKDLEIYKNFLKKEKIDHKKLIKYFSETESSTDGRFDPKNYHLPRRKNYGFNKLNIQNKEEKYFFYVSIYQTTNSQFNSFLKHSGYNCNYKYPKHEHNHPVAWVSWYDSIEYCKWLSKILKKNLVMESKITITKDFRKLLNDSNYQICLLSEDEWIYAATLGRKKPYPWGNKISTKYCNYKTSKIKKTCPVGCYIEGISESGLFDLSGNTWEWLRTKWGPSFEERKYKRKLQIIDDRNNINNEKNFLRALKGGSFLVENKRLKIYFEDAVPPKSKDDGDGFRIGLVKIK